MVARLDYFRSKFREFVFLTCLDRKKVILYLWTNLIETILGLFCSLFVLVSLYFVHKKIFSIIFTCLNMLSLIFCDKIYVKNNVKILKFLGQNFQIFRSKSGCLR